MLATPVEKCGRRREFSLAGDTASATRRWLRSTFSEYLVREQLDTAVPLVEEIVGSSSRPICPDPVTAVACGLVA
jgi:hypothetical protein